MLRPIVIEPVPHETARVARAVFPKGHWCLRLADELETLFADKAFLVLFPRTDNRLCYPGGWRSSPCCNSQKGCATAKRRTPYEVASTGRRSCVWSSRILGLMHRFSVNFAPACWPGEQSICSSTRGSHGAATTNWSTWGAAPEGESGDASRAGHAPGGRQAEGLRLVIEYPR